MNPLDLLSLRLSRRFGWPTPRPINLVVSLLYTCNARCQTCKVWKKQARNLTVQEYDQIFHSIGKGPLEIILTGGEPFLREDIVGICLSAVSQMAVSVIIIPTNGLLTDRIVSRIQEMLDRMPNTTFVINVSLDEVGETNDEIRGVPGYFERATATFRRLRAIENSRLELKIHTVVSKFNVRRIPEIYEYFRQELEPNAFITEIAEERRELGTIGADITPSADEYAAAIDALSEKLRREEYHGLSRITQAFRLEYYQLVKRILRENRQVIPCYAGWASAQIAANGDVWMCRVRENRL